MNVALFALPVHQLFFLIDLECLEVRKVEGGMGKQLRRLLGKKEREDNNHLLEIHKGF